MELMESGKTKKHLLTVKTFFPVTLNILMHNLFNSKRGRQFSPTRGVRALAQPDFFF